MFTGRHSSRQSERSAAWSRRHVVAAVVLGAFGLGDLLLLNGWAFPAYMRSEEHLAPAPRGSVVVQVERAVPGADGAARVEAAERAPSAPDPQRSSDAHEQPPPPTSVAEAATPRLLATIYFTTESWRLDDDALRQLERLAARVPQGRGQILVVGHTDARGEASYNYQLSLLRAETVVEQLQREAQGAQLLLPQGRGSSEPASADESPASLARNRRVEIFHLLRPPTPGGQG